MVDEVKLLDHPFRLAKPYSDLFLEIGGYESVRKFELGGLYLVDGKVTGLYWDPEERQNLELPLYTDFYWGQDEI